MNLPLRFSSLTSRLRAGILAGIVLSAIAGSATAQGLFAPVITVNDQVITRYELEQRSEFLKLLAVPGIPEQLAREALIEDRLKLQAAISAGLEVTPEEIEGGIEELSSRTDLSPEEFVKALEQGGVSVETLRDFAKVNVAWRNLIRARFLSLARPSEAEIDRAIGSGGGGGLRVLLSELIIPVTPQTQEQVDELALQLSQIRSYDAFSEAAGKYSATQTRANGGRMDWINLTDLPPGLRPLILDLTPGEVTAPIPLPEAVALFQLRAIKESAVATPRYSTIDYALYYLPGGRTPEALGRAARIANDVDTCDDLYGVAKNQPATQLEMLSQKPSEIPRDVAVELAKLDEGEISTALTRSNGQTLVLLMACGRTAEANEEATREQVAQSLVQQKLRAYADSYLDQLEAEAIIVER
ncbi:peptidylprolyl isomerase [Sedimentitalea todarodis]|uniref:Parvulin-like PPIase n=1 Tax=Sedimentitalea todarodis TaxID=1631240 RepID=A0ABU3VC58_9RHOB|nr:peptidylprolyl isomerase [Sedimentitalea todarodis]MDU9003773.1 peptidylprolyl isomerase [Sedimentitalea todarodis]